MPHTPPDGHTLTAPDSAPRGERLYLGCFDCVVPGWRNSDVTPHIWIARVPLLPALLFKMGMMTSERFHQHRTGLFRCVHYLDVTRRFPYGDGTVEAVFSFRFLEHLFRDEAEFCLAEIHRVLRPNGVCRIAVPDLERMVGEYDREAPETFLQRIFEVSDRKSIKNLHHWHYNEASLMSLLRGKGFREAYRCNYREGRCPDLELLDNRPDESLYMEGVK